MTREEKRIRVGISLILDRWRTMNIDKDRCIDEILELASDGALADVSGRTLMSDFWKQSAHLIDKYRDDGDERAAQGVVSCRILINRLMNPECQHDWQYVGTVNAEFCSKCKESREC